MKVQFESGRIRLRVSRAELEALCESQPLATSMDWPGGWRVEVAGAARFAFEATGATLRIALAQASLAALAARLPARDGLREALQLPGGDVELRFEVDLHDGRRTR